MVVTCGCSAGPVSAPLLRTRPSTTSLNYGDQGDTRPPLLYGARRLRLPQCHFCQSDVYLPLESVLLRFN
ncbi:hypothetical protein E2C01_092548 [Portunus trituberculatus]|uniref:Uncharacterized protein n=1 Tax=Portunus trituberculatus TaxID=210409 RepID=A0A5B7JY18_PORTR|nr:hypothetical protein [Portunus trituberculatus]